MTRDYKSVGSAQEKPRKRGGFLRGLFLFLLGGMFGSGLGVWLGWSDFKQHQTFIDDVQQTSTQEPHESIQIVEPEPVPPEPKPEPVKKVAKLEVTKEEAEELVAQVDEPTFDFYNLLPEMEVQLPENTVELPVQERDQTPDKADSKYKYGLQIASFRNYYDARRLKAQLAVLGLDAHLSLARTDSSVWHRVRLGPFYSVRDMDKTQRILQQNNLNSMRYRITE